MGWNSYNLVTFGCSHTYGTGLPDCWIPEEEIHAKHPSSLAWPAQLQERVGFKSLYNMSRPGASNKIILKNIVDYEYDKNTVVVVLWSNVDRHTIFKNKDKHSLHLMPHFPKISFIAEYFAKWHGAKDGTDLQKKSQLYFENFHEDFDVCFDQIIRINYVHAFLKNKGIKSFHLLPEHDYENHKNYLKNLFLENANIKLFKWKKDFKIDEALDKPHAHPGMKSHVLFANNINGWFFK